MPKAALWIGLAAVLATANWAIVGKERVLENGEVMLLQLAPRDPRSLLQGDYMALRYVVAADIDSQLGSRFSASGAAVVSLDEDNVAQFERLYDGNAELRPDERLLRYRKRGESLRVAGEAFFFEEGQENVFSPARYGELRVDERGEAVLVGLRDDQLNRLGVADE